MHSDSDCASSTSCGSGAIEASSSATRCRQQFAERLEVISYPERKRRATVGYVVLVGMSVILQV
jgi:hypothetical protein